MALSALSESETAATLEPSKPGTPYRHGIGRELPEAYRGNLAQSVRWTRLPSGAQVASFSVRSPGARALRLGMQATLPEGGVVRFFQPGRNDIRYPGFKRRDFRGASAIGQATAERGIAGARTRWSPTIAGDTVGIEIAIPNTASPAEVQFSVVRASHFWQSPAAMAPATTMQHKTTHACEPVPVACKSIPECPRGAVARINFTAADGASYLCSGTAINSGRSEFDNVDHPFFLTANHCVGSQSVAESVESRWHFEYQSCDGTVLNSGDTTLRGGADLVAQDPDTDGTLLRLRNALPAGACLAGWNAADGLASNTPVSSLHHPDGRAKAWAGGTIDDVGPAESDDGSLDVIGALWTEGGTSPGSSGAGLFVTNDGGEDELVGTLVGGSSGGCSLDFYGRFDRFFVNEAHTHLLPDAEFPEDDHGDGASNATGVLLNSEIGGSLDNGADADVFRIDVVDAGAMTVYTTGSVDTFGRLKRPDGSTIAESDDEGLEQNFRIEVDVQAGTYFIKVTGYDHTELGDYRLHVEFTPKALPSVLVPLFLSASQADETGRETFVRVTNRSNRSGEVTIKAIDDRGDYARDEAGVETKLTLNIKAYETKSFNSGDFEAVNANKGLSGASRLAPGTGHWRLQLDSDLDIDVAAFVRTEDGFLTSVHDRVAYDQQSAAYYVPIFNPASNVNQRSLLRLINSDANRTVHLLITGYDDAGVEGFDTVGLHIDPGAALLLDAMRLEMGRGGLAGRLGDGKGKWRLFIEADGEIVVLHLLESPTGNLTNLSTLGGSNYRR